MGWDKSRSNLTSTKVEFEVEDGLGKIRCSLIMICLFWPRIILFRAGGWGRWGVWVEKVKIKLTKHTAKLKLKLSLVI